MQTFETPEPISVDVEIGVGDIRIDASDRTDTTVEVRPSDPAKKADVAAAEQTRVEYANGHLVVKAASNWRQWLPHRGGGSIDVQISSPTGSRVRTEAGVATLHGRGQFGECRCKVGVGDIQLDETGPLDVKTGAGDVTVEGVVGKAEIVTGSGSVSVGVVDGTLSAKSANGDIGIGEVTREARVRSANGRIAVGHAREGVVVKTANGSVRIDEIARGTTVAQTAAGDVEVGIRDGVAAWLDLDTKFGNVRNELDDSPSPRAGDETVEVRASTSFGDIAIHRSFAARAGSDAS